MTNRQRGNDKKERSNQMTTAGEGGTKGNVKRRVEVRRTAKEETKGKNEKGE